MNGNTVYTMLIGLTVVSIFQPHPVLLVFIAISYGVIAWLLFLCGLYLHFNAGYMFKYHTSMAVARGISLASSHSSKGKFWWLIRLLFSIVLINISAVVYWLPLILFIGHASFYFGGESFLRTFEKFAVELLNKQRGEA